MAEIRDFSGELVAACSGCNPLAPGSAELPAPTGAVAAWSGRAEGDETGVRTWGPAGWSAFLEWCDRVGPGFAAAGAELWIRPHAAHVLSDAQRCVTFLRGREGGPIGLLFDPVSMLTGSMEADAPDHLARMFGAVAPLAGARALWLPRLGDRALSGLGDGGRGMLSALVAEHWGRERPVVLGGEGRDNEGAWLAALQA